MTTNKSTPIQLSPQICAKLKTLGLTITPTSQVKHNLLFRGQAILHQKTQLSRLKIDAYSYMGVGSVARSTVIGRYCSIAHKVEIGIPQRDFSTLSASSAFCVDSDFGERVAPIKRLDPYVRAHGDESCPVHIGHDVWIGAGVYIAPGVTIGTGAVIGTGSIITHDVPPYAVVAGRDDSSGSASIIKRYRFSDEVISDLLELKWWLYDLPQVMGATQDFHRMPFEDVRAFIAFMKNADTTYWPRLSSQWYCLQVTDSSTVQLSEVGDDFDLGRTYSQEECRALTWR